MRACAETGGVIGINGVGYWCGDNDDADTEAIFRCLDYTVELVGAEHVGLGFDYIHDLDGIIAMRPLRPHCVAGVQRRVDVEAQFRRCPEQMPDLVQQMLDHGYPDDAIVGILGANWERVANRVWRTA